MLRLDKVMKSARTTSKPSAFDAALFEAGIETAVSGRYGNTAIYVPRAEETRARRVVAASLKQHWTARYMRASMLWRNRRLVTFRRKIRNLIFSLRREQLNVPLGWIGGNTHISGLLGHKNPDEGIRTDVLYFG